MVYVSLPEKLTAGQNNMLNNLSDYCTTVSKVHTSLRKAEKGDPHERYRGLMVGLGLHLNLGFLRSFQPGNFTKRLWREICTSKRWKFDESDTVSPMKVSVAATAGADQPDKCLFSPPNGDRRPNITHPPLTSLHL